MPGTLPPILPGSSHAGGPPMTSIGGWNRAQNRQLGTLRQHTERQNAKVSMNQVISGSQGNTKSTSVYHPGGAAPSASTSIAHAGQARTSVQGGDEGLYDKGADDRRYAYMQKQIKARQKFEKEHGGIHAGTGGAFSKKKFHKKIRKLVYGNRAKYKNISKEDRSFFEKVVGKYAKGRTAGTGYGPTAKKRMRLEMDRARRAGKITAEDAKDFKGIINDMT